MKSAVRYAGEHGVIIVASAGNAGRNVDLLPSYPASLPDPAVVSVGATTSAGRLWSGSNIGLRTVDVAAPGEFITSTARNSGYQMRTGTSAAAPFVAGSLAPLSAARPAAPLPALRDALLATTRRTDVISTVIGGGHLDVGAAMRQVAGARRLRTAAPAAAAATLRLRAESKVRAGARATLCWKAAGTPTVDSWRVSLNGHVIATLPATASRVARRVARAGRHKWRVVGLDAEGDRVVTAMRAFRAVASRKR